MTAASKQCLFLARCRPKTGWFKRGSGAAFQGGHNVVDSPESRNARAETTARRAVAGGRGGRFGVRGIERFGGSTDAISPRVPKLVGLAAPRAGESSDEKTHFHNRFRARRAAGGHDETAELRAGKRRR